MTDPETLRRRLAGAGARPGFSGRMDDRRLDRHGELMARDEVLRIRRFRPSDGSPSPSRTTVSWKGPVRRTPEGYKERDEIEVTCSGPDDPRALWQALGYTVVHAIDRYVEYFALGDATVRLEWYPHMDVLVEVEGAPGAIEAAMGHLALPREAFTAESLVDFAARFEARTGEAAVLDCASLQGRAPSWEGRS